LSVAIGAEVLTPWQWFGGLLLVGGVVIGELPDDAAPAPARAD
jgi:drug/metabolite transporter (DMT)-like permease